MSNNRRWLSAVAVVALTVMHGSDANAQQVARPPTVLEIFESCEEVAGGSRSANIPGTYCAGLISGIHFALGLHCDSLRFGYSPAPEVLMGSMPSNRAGAQAFVDWAREKPERWGMDYTTAIAIALTEAFPCQN